MSQQRIPSADSDVKPIWWGESIYPRLYGESEKIKISFRGDITYSSPRRFQAVNWTLVHLGRLKIDIVHTYESSPLAPPEEPNLVILRYPLDTVNLKRSQVALRLLRLTAEGFRPKRNLGGPDRKLLSGDHKDLDNLAHYSYGLSIYPDLTNEKFPGEAYGTNVIEFIYRHIYSTARNGVFLGKNSCADELYFGEDAQAVLFLTHLSEGTIWWQPRNTIWSTQHYPIFAAMHRSGPGFEEAVAYLLSLAQETFYRAGKAIECWPSLLVFYETRVHLLSLNVTRLQMWDMENETDWKLIPRKKVEIHRRWDLTKKNGRERFVNDMMSFLRMIPKSTVPAAADSMMFGESARKWCGSRIDVRACV